MRCALLILTLGGAALAEYPRYVRVPNHSLDRLVYEDALAGKIKLRDKMHIKNGAVWTTVDGKPFMFDEAAFALFLGLDVHYDNRGNYFVSEALYEKYKERLPKKAKP